MGRVDTRVNPPGRWEGWIPGLTPLADGKGGDIRVNSPEVWIRWLTPQKDEKGG